MLCLLSGQQSYSQVSSGGMPPSFSFALNAAVPTIIMPPIDVAALLAEDSIETWSGNNGQPVAPRFAYAQEVALHPGNSGVWETLEDGTRIWRLRIVSPGASSVHLTYSSWDFPNGARLYLYDDSHVQLLGAFTSINNWPDGTNITGPITGEATTLEYTLPRGLDQSPGNWNLVLSSVCHAYRSFSEMENTLDLFGDSHDCQVNINCPEAAAFSDERRGIAMIISGATRWCTGSLVADVARSWTPYLLTASHCLNGNQSNWLFIFNYESPNCNDIDGPLNQSVANATLKANWPYNQGSDFALFELSNSIPEAYNPYFNGWDRSDNPATGVTGISHPRGDIKKYAYDTGTLSHDDWGSGPPNTHWRLNYDIGGMEQGSSGSPAFNSSGRIIGQLTGGYEACQIVDESWYGKFGYDWNGGGTQSTSLRLWLDPANLNPQWWDGSDPVAPSNDRWPGVYIYALPFAYSGTTAYAEDDYEGSCAGHGARDVVFYFYARCSGQVTVSACGSRFDTGLSVVVNLYSQTPEEIACNDDDTTCTSPLGSRVTFYAFEGETYYFVIDGIDSTNCGMYTLNVTGELCPPAHVTLQRLGANMQLNWDAVSGASSYNIYRLTSSESERTSESLIATVSALSFTDLGIVNATAESHFYCISAVVP